MKLSRPPTRKARIEIVPMIDTVFFLLVFFMMASLSMTAYRGIPVSLPRAASGSAAPSETITITVTPAGETYLEGRPGRDGCVGGPPPRAAGGGADACGGDPRGRGSRPRPRGRRPRRRTGRGREPAGHRDGPTDESKPTVTTRPLMWATAASMVTHLVALASSPVLFVALAPTSTPIPVEVLGLPAPPTTPAATTPPARPRARPAARSPVPAPREALQAPRLLDSPLAAPLAQAPSVPPPPGPADTGLRAPTTMPAQSLPEPAMAASVSGLLPGPGTRPGPSLLPEAGSGRAAPTQGPDRRWLGAGGAGTAGERDRLGEYGRGRCRLALGGRGDAGRCQPRAIGEAPSPPSRARWAGIR